MLITVRKGSTVTCSRRQPSPKRAKGAAQAEGFVDASVPSKVPDIGVSWEAEMDRSFEAATWRKKQEKKEEKIEKTANSSKKQKKCMPMPQISNSIVYHTLSRSRSEDLITASDARGKSKGNRMGTEQSFLFPGYFVFRWEMQHFALPCGNMCHWKALENQMIASTRRRRLGL